MKILTIIVTTFNREDALKNCLSLLVPITNLVDVIVVDDSDAPTNIAKAILPTCTYIHKSELKRGVAESRNLAMQLVDTEYLIFLDDDDEILSPALEGFIKGSLPSNKFDIIFFGHIKKELLNRNTELEPECRITTFSPSRLNLETVKICNFAPIGSFIIRNQSTLPRFDTALRTHEDWDFLLNYLSTERKIDLCNEYMVIINVGLDLAKTRRHSSGRRHFYEDFLLIYSRYPASHLEDFRQKMLQSLLLFMTPNN